MDKFGNKNPNEVASHMDSEKKTGLGYMPINRKATWSFAAMSRSAGPNFTDFQTAMGLFDSFGLRGKSLFEVKGFGIVFCTVMFLVP